MRDPYFRVLLCSILFAACSSPESTSLHIVRLEDQRAGASALAAFFASTDVRIRQQAINAAGKMLDTTAVPLILPFLADSAAAVRQEAAFALGQLGTAAARSPLLEHWPVEHVPAVRQALMGALGKAGDTSVVRYVAEALEDRDDILRGEAALAVARLAVRGIPVQYCLPRLDKLFSAAPAGVRWRAAYALMRIADSSSRRVFINLLADNDPRVRMMAARGLGALRGIVPPLALSDAARTDADWRVRVNAARALGFLLRQDVLNNLPLQDQNEHVRLAALQALGMIARALPDADPQLAAIRTFLREQLAPENSHGKSWYELGATALALAQADSAGALEVLRPRLQGADAYLGSRLAAALGESKDPAAVPLLQRLFETGPGPVRVAVLEALANFTTPAAAGIALQALSAKDPVLTALAAKYLADRAVPDARYGAAILQSCQELLSTLEAETAEMIFAALAKLKVQAAVPLLEAALAHRERAVGRSAAVALEKLTGRSYADQLPRTTAPHVKFADRDLLSLRGKHAVITTRYGNMEFALYTDEAPLTCLNFVRLAKQGFYNGLTFHRVVPNFVIQGGDPRGDSWGSPGYTIRSEFNAHQFARGTLGMASAGPDTEGSQFFITHSPQPHLDGKYTAFGRLVRGGEVLDAIQPGTVIKKVAIE